MTTTTKAAHTPGPWYLEIEPYGIDIVFRRGKDSFCIAEVEYEHSQLTPEIKATASLIAAAPAQDLILQMFELGIARLEVCSHEFVFNGLRYSIGEERDWDMILNVIGWDAARAAVQKARGGR